jgi:pimeloyl-ACP methyl ester carboxylesterase
MQRIQRFPRTLRPVVLAGVALAGTLGAATPAAAQAFEDLQTPKSPLVLKDHGSFFVGGEVKEADSLDLGAGRPPGQFVANQMYVEYMIPHRKRGGHKVPVVMIHGGGLSGKSYETTPDGRMGWADYFVRKGHAVYLPDQVSRARSGFDPTVFNRVRDGRLPPTELPSVNRTSLELAWDVFRFGPTFPVPFPDEQFPVEAAVEFSKQGVPDLNAILPSPNPNYKALSDLAIKLKGAVLMGHSQSGAYPLQAALTDPTGTKGLIAMEGVCTPTAWTDDQIATLATVPILVVFGDHLADAANGIWQTRFDDCQAFITRVNAAGGNAQMLWPPALGIHGNSHMIMQDKNNLQIADLILEWIDENVGKDKVARK